MNTKRILIVGGMGPQASLTLHQKIIEKAAQQGAMSGDDFPEIIHISMPIPEFIDSKANLQRALALIKERLYCLWQTRLYSYCYCL